MKEENKAKNLHHFLGWSSFELFTSFFLYQRINANYMENFSRENKKSKK